MGRQTEIRMLELGEKIVLAVKLDGKNSRERVVIGERRNVYRRLINREEGEVLLDAERPLGKLLYEFDEQEKDAWNGKMIRPLCEALRSFIGRVGREKLVWDLFKSQLNSGNAVTVYTGYCMCFYYTAGLTMLGDNLVALLTEGKMQELVRSFSGGFLQTEEGYSVKEGLKEIQRIENSSRFLPESHFESWNLWESEGPCFVTEGNLLPIIREYLHWLLEKKRSIKVCDVCGERFIPSSGHHTLCDDCKAIQKRRNEKAYDERAKENRYDKMYQKSTRHMRCCLNRFEARDDVSKEQCEEAESIYETIRTEAKQMKKAIKTEKEILQFQDWLFQQERFLDDLCRR